MSNNDVKNIKKEARSLKRFLKYDITLDGLEKYALRMGFLMCFFGDNGIGDKKLRSMGCESKALSCPSFLLDSQYAKLIFVDGRRSESEKIQLALHEIGHIVLKHLDSKKDAIEAEIEADVYICEVQKYLNFKRAIFQIINWIAQKFVTVLATLIILIVEMYLNIKGTTPQNLIADSSASDICVVSAMDYYITPHGQKYHNLNCSYIKNRKCRLLTTDELSDYEPCSVCIGEK